MSESTMALPGRRQIAAALRQASERFTAELNAPIAEAPAWNDFEWRAAMAVAAMHGVSALLATRLAWRGPQPWQDFLAEQREQGLLREQRVRALLKDLDAAAREAGLPLMALKGSALLNLGLYGAGERPQSDIDLLCRPEDEAAAMRLIESIGYEVGVVSWKHREYRPPGLPAARAFGEHIDNPHKIELHTGIGERLPHREYPLGLKVADQRPGLHAYPDRPALLRHLLLHAAGNLCVRGGRLIQLHDIALMCRSLNVTEQARLFADAAPWWAWPPLMLAERCFPGSVAPALLARAAESCPWHLQRWIGRHSFEALSLVDPHITALPGLAWSEDASAALQYVGRQIVPERETTRLRLSMAPQTPAAAGQTWATQPQWQRALRWLAARPPRLLTLHSLRTACSYRPAPAQHR